MLSTSFDVIELLTRDHRLLERLLEQLNTEEQPIQGSILFVQIIRELAAHEMAEQQVVFPAFRSALPAVEQAALDRLRDHEEINGLLAEMRTLMPDEPGFQKRASALHWDLQAHFEAEENALFPRLRACMAHDKLVELADRVLAARATHPAPARTEVT
jgi:hemerythrin superfamily protein